MNTWIGILPNDLTIVADTDEKDAMYVWLKTVKGKRDTYLVQHYNKKGPPDLWFTYNTITSFLFAG